MRAKRQPRATGRKVRFDGLLLQCGATGAVAAHGKEVDARRPDEGGNAICVYRHYPAEDGTTVYSDNQSCVFYDRPVNRGGHLPMAGMFAR